MPSTPPTSPLLYTNADLDRAGPYRENPDWIEAARANPATRWIAYWRGQLLIDGDASAARAIIDAAPPPNSPSVFLGLWHDHPVFAADLSHHAEPLAALARPRGQFAELRAIASGLPASEAGLLATARGLLWWQSRHQFCGLCGGACTPERAGHVMRCTACRAEHFPRTDPAVIMLVYRDDRLLLGQSHKFPIDRNFFSTLAGFVEPGESLEETVRREVFEEVGVRVGDVTYEASQPWPFPASLMLGFRAEARTETITLDTNEMRAARWFTPADIANRHALGFNLPPRDSIARRLIESFLAGL
ncbi:MAG TPA: NAD(+) diphosphatase [Acidiphilium sp.]|nr:MAG: NADH pyrophosphatase [Acidiphilium sp. 21-60-14]HQT89801.1 NAD(+) diphosphatase [Acidiphilium sp.]HQU25260.1 NAD(+) diphosphatase [Acidiphilium sp.]